MCQGIRVPAVWLGVMMSTLLILVVDCKECLKRQEIGHRVNNDYECNHPVYSECCEHQNRFTCCEPNWRKNLREQLQLLGTLGVMVVVVGTLCACLRRDRDLVHSETLQEVLGRAARKIHSGKKEGKEEDRRKEEEEQMEEGGIHFTDQVPLTESMVPPIATTTSFIHLPRHI